ncbi:MAG: hypothetical protein O7G84_14515 [Gammaproteobacteria bacterium]|jgi:hypothetical protein|nr:hypothetical protein [Gammaproteobacteria bacterium]
MAAVILTLVISFMAAGVLWLVAGGRFQLDDDVQQNDILNLAIYTGILIVPVFLLVFLLLPL